MYSDQLIITFYLLGDDVHGNWGSVFNLDEFALKKGDDFIHWKRSKNAEN